MSSRTKHVVTKTRYGRFPWRFECGLCGYGSEAITFQGVWVFLHWHLRANHSQEYTSYVLANHESRVNNLAVLRD